MLAPFQTYMTPSITNDIPTAVISGASLGLLRRGRYATRSIPMLMTPMIAITTRKTTSRAGTADSPTVPLLAPMPKP